MKAILVVDNPTSCRECTLRTSLEANKFHCLAILPRKEIKPYEEQKPSWCPLKPMPQKVKSASEYESDDEYIKRLIIWKKQVDEITGETE